MLNAVPNPSNVPINVADPIEVIVGRQRFVKIDATGAEAHGERGRADDESLTPYMLWRLTSEAKAREA